MWLLRQLKKLGRFLYYCFSGQWMYDSGDSTPLPTGDTDDDRLNKAIYILQVIGVVPRGVSNTFTEEVLLDYAQAAAKKTAAWDWETNFTDDADRICARILGYENKDRLIYQSVKNDENCKHRIKELMVLFASEKINRVQHLSSTIKAVYQCIWNIIHPIHEFVNYKGSCPEIDEATLRLKELAREKAIAFEKAEEASIKSLKESNLRLKAALALRDEVRADSRRKNSHTSSWSFWNIFSSPVKNKVATETITNTIPPVVKPADPLMAQQVVIEQNSLTTQSITTELNKQPLTQQL